MAYFVDRNTKKLETSVSTPPTPDPDKIKNPDLTGLYDFVTKSYLVPSMYWKIEGDTISEMTSAEKNAVDASDEYLIPAKQKKFTAIDIHTDELIALGFTFDSKQFSNSLFGQSKMTGAFTIRDLPEFSYPVVWNTLDNMGKITISDAATMKAFYLTAVGTIRAHLDSGTALKDQVRAANNTGAVEEVVDTR
jgi:hypothetical protein